MGFETHKKSIATSLDHISMKSVIAIVAFVVVQADVNCGSNRAATCVQCPPTKDAKQVWKWCSGDCVWSEGAQKCGLKSEDKHAADHDGYMPATASTGAVSCGKQRASSCGDCPPSKDPKQVWKWCTGDCVWNERDKKCHVATKDQLDATSDGYSDSMAAYKEQEL